MAAHVFDAAEPTLEPTIARKGATSGAAAAAIRTDAPMFAAQPAVFQRMQERRKLGAAPLIGLAVGAVLVGGVMFATSRHHQAAHSAASGQHTAAPPAQATPAATPAPAPTVAATRPAPAAAPAPPAPSLSAPAPQPAPPPTTAPAPTEPATPAPDAPAAGGPATPQ